MLLGPEGFRSMPHGPEGFSSTPHGPEGFSSTPHGPEPLRVGVLLSRLAL